MGFFQQYLEKSHHLLIFKNAILCIFPKPDKYYQALLIFYQLIAILLCLKKEVESFVAKTLNNTILKLQFISLLYFSAIAKNFTINAATTLTHNIKKSFQKREILTSLVFNIKKPFDRVIDHRFFQRL